MRTLGGGAVSWDKTRHGSHPSLLDAKTAAA
jgi:hypothetical protein